MIHAYVALLILALLPIAGCGGCGRDEAPPSRATTTTVTTAPPTTTPPTTTTLPAVSPDEKYTLYRPSAWKVGDVVTNESTTVTTGRFRGIAADGRSSTLPPLRQTINAKWTERTSEVDASGARTRYVVQISEWARRRERERDRSLEGARLTVSVAGATPQWSLEQSQMKPTDEARQWLDDHFGSHGLSDEEVLRLMLTDEAVAPGASWHPDPDRLAEQFARTGAAVEGSRPAATVTFVSVDGGAANLTFEVTVPLRKVPDTDIEWSKGGDLTLKGDVTVTLEPAPIFLSVLHTSASLTGEAPQDGGTVEYDLTTDERRTATKAGSLPPQ
jgi:hypothetical protein